MTGASKQIENMARRIVALEDEVAQLKQSIKTIVKEDGVVVSRQAREIARLQQALQTIATRTYPAVYLGEDKNGTKMYGGSDDASRFAREALAESRADPYLGESLGWPAPDGPPSRQVP